MSYQYTFTVFTPTYNRAYLLHRVHDSLLEQTFKDFEWVIVDDGSTDNTQDLVNAWIEQAPFTIRYYFQDNGGKHRAFNHGVREAKGRFFLTFDSDDACTPNALERLLFHWDTIPAQDRKRFSAVTALSKTADGVVIGTHFPKEVFDSDSVTVKDKYGAKGDKWGFQRTDVLMEFPFPEIEGETFITESIVWNRIGMKYKTRYINESLQIKEYMSDGLTVNGTRVRVQNPRGSLLYDQERLSVCRMLVDRVKTAINYLRYALHAGCAWKSLLRVPGSRTLLALLFPVSALMYVKDRLSVP